MPRALVLIPAGIAAAVALLLLIGVAYADGKSAYELIKDLFVPLIGPLVAVLIPVLVLYLLPLGQSQQKLALDLCTQYFSEEMRDARNIAWQHFVTEQRTLPPVRRAEQLNHFLDYLSEPEVHRSVDAQTDIVYQKSSRVLEFFALINGCIARGVADPDIVRDFLLFYYLWWRDEIMEPLRKTQRIAADHPKVKPVWWEPLRHLDALAEPR